MHEFTAALCLVTKFSDGQRVDAPPKPVARFEYEDTPASPPKFTGRHETCSSGTDDYDVRVSRGHALSYELFDRHPARPALALYPEALFHLSFEIFSVERPVETEHDEHSDDAAHERI